MPKPEDKPAVPCLTYKHSVDLGHKFFQSPGPQPQGETIMPTIAEKLRQEGRLEGKRIALMTLINRKFTLSAEEKSLIRLCTGSCHVGPGHGIRTFECRVGENFMKTSYIYWQDDTMWIGYLEEFPDYWTQGETLEELKENLRDIHYELSSGTIANVRRADDLELV